MKRILIACLILALVAGLSGGALWLQHDTTEQLLTDCDRLVALYRSGNIAAAMQAADEFPVLLQDKMRWFPFFLRHERLETVYQQAAALPLLVETRDDADFLSTVSSIRMQLEILMDGEWPNLENIL